MLLFLCLYSPSRAPKKQWRPQSFQFCANEKAIPSTGCDWGKWFDRTHQNEGKETGTPVHNFWLILHRFEEPILLMFAQIQNLCVHQWPPNYPRFCERWFHLELHASTSKCYDRNIFIIRRFFFSTRISFFSTRNFPTWISNFITIFRFFWKQPKNPKPRGKGEVPKVSWLNISHC